MPAKKVNQKKQPTKANKIILRIVMIIVILVAIVAAISFAQTPILRISLTAESNKALSNSQTQIETAANEYIKQTALKLGVNSTPVYSVVYDSCYTDHNDSGWTATSYNYKCFISNFAFFEVEDDSVLKKAITQYAKPGSEISYSYDGEIYTLYPTDSEAYATLKDMPSKVSVVKNNTYANVQDVLKVGAVSYNMNVVTYANTEAISNREVLKEQGAQSLDVDKTYIVLESAKHYFQKSVGCRIPNILFCSSPL